MRPWSTYSSSLAWCRRSLDSRRYDYVALLLNDLHWLNVSLTSCAFRCTTQPTVFMARRRATYTRCHSASCWSNVAPSIVVCIVIRSYGASNTSFITWRLSLKAFAVVGPRSLSNNLPQFVTDCPPPLTFKKIIYSRLTYLAYYFRARIRLLTV